MVYKLAISYNQYFFVKREDDTNMDQLVVTVNDSRLLPILEKAIGLLKGVAKAEEMRSEEKELDNTLCDIPSVFKDLIGATSGFTKEEIEEDARLSYL